MSIILGYDPTTLREKVDLLAAGERLDELGGQRSSAAMNERVGLLRLVGRLDEAWDAANAALRQARMSGDREQLCLARIRRAWVQVYRGKPVPAVIELTSCTTEARDHDWTGAEALALQVRGIAYFDQAEYQAALTDFRTAATIRVSSGAPADDVESSMMAITIAESYVAEPRRPH